MKHRVVEYLLDIAKIVSPSAQEGPMVKAITKIVGKEHVQMVGKNLVVGSTSGSVCVNAHMDHVTGRNQKDICVIYTDNIIGQFAHNANGPIGLDDKVGIAIALAMRDRFGDDISLLFTVCEEIGGHDGAMSLPEEVKYDFSITCDRRGTGHVVEDICGPIISKSAKAALGKLLKPHGWRWCHGAFADPMALVSNGHARNAVNIECGYYNPHYDSEFGRFNEMVAAYDMACRMCELALKWASSWKTCERNRQGLSKVYSCWDGWSDRPFLSGTRHYCPYCLEWVDMDDDMCPICGMGLEEYGITKERVVWE